MIIFEQKLKTRKGSVVKRSRYGVGKDIGGSLYVHLNYVPYEFKRRVDESLQLLKESYPHFHPNVVRIDYKKTTNAFYESTEFDIKNEPEAGMMIVVDNDTHNVSNPKHIKQIWHHKWLWVDDSYQGFNVKDAIERSRTWLDNDDIPFARIGNKTAWQDWLKSVDLIE